MLYQRIPFIKKITAKTKNFSIFNLKKLIIILYVNERGYTLDWYSTYSIEILILEKNTLWTRWIIL